VEEVLDRAGIIASLRTPEVDFVREGAGHVRQLWEMLRLEAERRSVMLDAVLQAQQYYSEAVKVESWLSGQKLQVANEEKGTVRKPIMPIIPINVNRSGQINRSNFIDVYMYNATFGAIHSHTWCLTGKQHSKNKK